MQSLVWHARVQERTRHAVTVDLLAIGVFAWLGLSVYPFQYGPDEGLLLAGLFVVAGYVELVMDDALTER